RMQPCETSNVRFVHDGAVPRHAPRPGLSLPIEVGINHDAFRYERRAVTLVKIEIVSLGADGVAETLRRTFECADVRASVRIEQQLIRIEPVPRLRIVRSVHA